MRTVSVAGNTDSRRPKGAGCGLFAAPACGIRGQRDRRTIMKVRTSASWLDRIEVAACTTSGHEPSHRVWPPLRRYLPARGRPSPASPNNPRAPRSTATAWKASCTSLSAIPGLRILEVSARSASLKGRLPAIHSHRLWDNVIRLYRLASWSSRCRAPLVLSGDGPVALQIVMPAAQRTVPSISRTKPALRPRRPATPPSSHIRRPASVRGSSTGTGGIGTPTRGKSAAPGRMSSR